MLYPNTIGTNSNSRTIAIYTADITTNAKYMHDPNGKHDLLGQILYTGYNLRIPPKTRTPQELKKAIFPFTKLYRQYEYCNTALTLALLDLTSLPGKRQLVEANILLQPFGIILSDATESLKVEQEQEVALTMPLATVARLSMTNLIRTSSYLCTCGNTTALPSLVIDNDDPVEFACPYCHEPLTTERNKAILTKFPTIGEILGI